MCVDDRCTIVTSTPFSYSALQMSCAELLEPDHHGALADVAVRAGMRAGVVLIAAEHVLAGQRRHARLARHPGGQHQMRRLQRQPLAVAVHLDGPALGVLVERRRQARRLRPVRHLHHPGVELQPVADLVLGREHRPVLRERQVRQVVVPDRVVQAQRLVALAPLVARPLVAVDDDGGHPELAQPRAERDAALSAADDQRVRLRRAYRARPPRRPASRPTTAVSGSLPCTAPSTRDGPLRSSWPLSSCSAVSSVHAWSPLSRRWPMPRPTAVSNSMNADVTPPSSVGASRVRKPDGSVPASRAVEHVGDAVAALDGLDVPGEGDQVAPEAVGGELLRPPARCRGPPGPLRNRPARRRRAPAGSRWSVGSSVCVM